MAKRKQKLMHISEKTGKMAALEKDIRQLSPKWDKVSAVKEIRAQREKS